MRRWEGGRTRGAGKRQNKARNGPRDSGGHKTIHFLRSRPCARCIVSRQVRPRRGGRAPRGSGHRRPSGASRGPRTGPGRRSGRGGAAWRRARRAAAAAPPRARVHEHMRMHAPPRVRGTSNAIGSERHEQLATRLRRPMRQAPATNAAFGPAPPGNRGGSRRLLLHPQREPARPTPWMSAASVAPAVWARARARTHARSCALNPLLPSSAQQRAPLPVPPTWPASLAGIQKTSRRTCRQRQTAHEKHTKILHHRSRGRAPRPQRLTRSPSRGMLSLCVRSGKSNFRLLEARHSDSTGFRREGVRPCELQSQQGSVPSALSDYRRSDI